ncbi:uncharacterized protein ColSpa_09864 [Colletotrichum spaethianum]|uniref:Amidase n=1 Tax=Colletotrichum spaethianum TaxID=700344 RepID=A0AA37USC5_9PEZI|nr:uncharacterized protein ColSpa_09864 [Colletotrichum spaethianum]GKT49683.1 hypothetical protein ColSpa_09864 [Colletotrichum spaethianum]
MYIGQIDTDPSARKVYTRQSITDLWSDTRKTLEGLGASVQEVDFPVVTKFEKAESDGIDTAGKEGTAPPHRNDIDMCQLMAYAWDDFLADNKDASVAVSLSQVDPAAIFPRPLGSIPDKYDSNDPLVRHTDVVAHITAERIATYDIPGLGKDLHDLESRRKADFEDWLDALGLDTIVWPYNGNVGKADADVNEASATEAWRNGVLYSNGNCAIRQLGIPTVSVPMGVMADTGMPVNLTFASKAYDDNNLLRYAFAFKKVRHLRQAPPRTPALATDTISLVGGETKMGLIPPELVVDNTTVLDAKDGKKVRLSGRVQKEEVSGQFITVDGDEFKDSKITEGKWEADFNVISVWEGRPEEKGSPDPAKAMVVIVARGKNGRSAGKVLFI